MVAASGLAFGVATPALAAGACAAPTLVSQSFAAGSTGSYTVATGIQSVAVTAIGGTGADETSGAAHGGAGARLKTALTVTDGEVLDVAVGSTATTSAGGDSGGSASGGAGSDFIPPATVIALHSGGGGGASFVRHGGTVVVAAGAGGGAGAASPGGAAASSTSTSFAGGAVAAGADGFTVTDPPAGGEGGTGGTSVPGTGGTAKSGYGAGSGFDGVGEVGGNSFTNGGQSVGAGGGGGGYAGGGGGGGGGYAGGGGAGSSYSASDYTVTAASTAPAVTLSEVLAPVFTSASSTTLTAGKKGSFLVCAPAAVDPTFTVTGTLPAGIHLVDNGDGSASLTGTPTGAPGKYTFTVTATDSAGATSQRFTLTIDPATTLALTGTDAAPTGLVALALLVAGAGALVLGRRRRARG